jgi:hypothetical protein
MHDTNGYVVAMRRSGVIFGHCAMKRSTREPSRGAKKPRGLGGKCMVSKEPMENIYLKELQALQVKYPNWARYFSSEELYNESSQHRHIIEEQTHKLVEKYAWAVPDERSLAIISHFSPLIEVGAGKGYWARLLQGRGVDIISYDKFLPSKSNMWTEVRRGGPEVCIYIVPVYGLNMALCAT